MSWTIKSWERPLARGVITSPQYGDLPFDGAAAMVDDFVVGEPVEISLTPHLDGHRVVKIWPDDPRFAPRDPQAPHAPPLRDDTASRLARLFSALPVLLDYRITVLAEDLVVEADDDTFSYGPTYELRFLDPTYLEMPRIWSGKSFRLADDRERADLNVRCEITADSVAVRIVDDARNVFFVVCSDVVLRSFRSR